MANKAMKTEHNGAKNGGDYWGTRADAKRESNKRRRQDGRDYVAMFTEEEYRREAAYMGHGEFDGLEKFVAQW